MNEWGRVLTAMVTPFHPSGEINEDAIPHLVDHLFQTGSEGLVVCGTTGESPTLSHSEKLRMFKLVKQSARGRGAIIAGTGTNNTADSITLSREAAEIGVDGLLLVAPYYNKPSQEGLYQHFKAIAGATPVPAMVYNVPPRTSVNIEASTMVRLARTVPNIVAAKEAAGNMVQASEMVAGAPDGFRVYSGEDALVLPLLAVGGYGVVSVTSHLVGEDMQAMHQAYFGGNFAEAARLHAKMLPIVKACFQSTTPSPAPLKAGLNMLGVRVGGVRLPLVEANEVEAGIVKKAMCDYGLI